MTSLADKAILSGADNRLPMLEKDINTPQTPYSTATHFGVVTIHLEPYVPQREGNVITTDDQAEDQRKLVKASSIVRPDLDEPVTVKFMINGKIVYVTEQEIQAYRHKEEEIKKAEEEARLNAISKPEVIKVVCEEAKKQHTEKVRKSLELRKHMYDSYIWTVSSKLKRKPITAIKIHPKTKPVVITVYRGTDARNFNVHKPFLFRAFGISELDELREIISKKKNTVDCPFQPKTPDGDAKPESRWTPDKRRVTTQRGEKINEEWLTSSKKVSQCINEQIPHQKKKFLGGELLTESLSKININENSFIPASMRYDQEMVLKTKDWVERVNPDNKLPNFNTGRIIVFKSQAVNESLETLNTPESSKDSKAEFLTPLPPLKNLQEASLSSEVMPLTFQPYTPKETPGVVYRGTDGRNFNVHRPFIFGEFGISKLDELREIIPKNKNTMVKDLMNSISRSNGNSLYPPRRDTMEESLSKFMAESAKKHEENLTIIKEI
nr:retrovirus-related Pol polyprotein from transposon TNT 1-94 [Tanacetum cinerariifolium]